MPAMDQVAPFLDQMEESGIYSNFGPLVQRLEAEYASRFNVGLEQVVSVSSATLGLEGAIRTTGVATWMVPDFTFPATGLAVLGAGRELVLVDVDEQTWELPDSIVSDVGSEIGAIAVMAFGAPIDLNRWHGTQTLIIDAAASLGSSNLDLASLPNSWSVVFSLHATKVLPAGEGGIVIFGDAERARLFRAWSNFGFRGERVSTINGTNAKMSEIHAAYGLASLRDWEREKREWLEPLKHARIISQQLNLRMSRQDQSGVHPYWVVNFGNADRAQAITRALDFENFGYRFWWPSLHTMPAFRGISQHGDLQTSRSLSASVLGLPMYRGLATSHLNQLAEILNSELGMR